MARNHPPRSIIDGHQLAAILPLILLFISAVRGVHAQNPSNGNTSSTENNNNPYFQSANFNPSMAIVIVVLISAFFFLGFFSIYLRQCGGEGIESLAAAAVGGRSRRQRGLDPSILETFPTLVYSEVKEHKIGKGALECAICLNEFEDEDTIRLLPRCDHVFHQDCIDAWLATHVTCPVCRTNYSVVETALEPEALTAPPAAPPALPADQHMIAVDDEERKDEMREMARIANKARGNGSRRPRLPRSHSTGHSITRQGEGLDRYTLRLPEHVRKDIIAAGILRRSRSMAPIRGGEGSSRRISRGIGDGSTRRGRSVRLGRSDRWPSFFIRSLSTKIPAWANWRRGEEGSVKDGSVRDKVAGGGGSKHNHSNDPDETSTAALNRV